MNAPVNVVLDLRGLAKPPTTADELLALWSRVEAGLLDRPLRSVPVHRVEMPGSGWCDLWLTDPATAPDRVTPDVPFSIRSILEPGEIRYRCTLCETSGRVSYAPFPCEGCSTKDRSGRVCDDHAVFLDGSFRATCPPHTPRCPCGETATFWCRGPRCRRSKAHCGRHRRSHPGDPDVGYCLDCFAQVFPACSAPGCANTGNITCEFVTAAGLSAAGSSAAGTSAAGTSAAGSGACGRGSCAGHAKRWQVFGPQRRGLGLCPDHGARLSGLSRDQIVFQIVAGTAGRTGRDEQRLPRLSVVRHIFINVRNEALDMGVLDDLFVRLERGLGTGRLEETMRRLLKPHAGIREADLKGFRNEHALGQQHLARLQQVLRSQGRSELADAVTFSDYRAQSNILFVRVPPQLTGMFVGTQHRNVDALSAALGVKVQVERR